MRDLLVKYLYNLSVTALVSLLPLIVFPYVSRVLGPTAIGELAFIDASLQILIIITNLGISLYGIRESAKRKGKQEELRKFVGEITTIHFFMSVVSLLILAILSTLQPYEAPSFKPLLALGAVVLFNHAFTLDWLFHGLEDFKYLARRSYLSKLTGVLLIFLFIKNPKDQALYYGILVATNIVVVLQDWLALKKRGLIPTRVLHFSRLKIHFKPLFNFSLLSSFVLLFRIFDQVLLGWLSTALVVGFYSVAVKIIRLAQSLILDLGGVLYPRFVAWEADENEQNRQRTQTLRRQSLLVSLTLSIPLSGWIAFHAKDVILVLGGSSFLKAVPSLQILSLLPVFIGLSQFYQLQVLIPAGKEKAVAWISALSFLGKVFLLLICVGWWEVEPIKGASVVAVVIELLFLGLLMIYAHQNKPDLVLWSPEVVKLLMTCLLSTFIMLIPSWLLQNWETWTLLKLAVQALTAIAILMLCFNYLFPHPLKNQLKELVRNLFKKQQKKPQS